MIVMLVVMALHSFMVRHFLAINHEYTLCSKVPHHFQCEAWQNNICISLGHGLGCNGYVRDLEYY